MQASAWLPRGSKQIVFPYRLSPIHRPKVVRVPVMFDFLFLLLGVAPKIMSLAAATSLRPTRTLLGCARGCHWPQGQQAGSELPPVYGISPPSGYFPWCCSSARPGPTRTPSLPLWMSGRCPYARSRARSRRVEAGATRPASAADSMPNEPQVGHVYRNPRS